MICLQGGAEFGADGAAMDLELVQRMMLGPVVGPIVVTALAGAPGREYDTANRNGVRHFAGLVARAYSGPQAPDGRPPEVVAAPDARSDPRAAAEVISSSAMLVLPGGSPSRLLQALRSAGIDRLISDLLEAGSVVMGASAGAMVLCERTWLPDLGRIDAGLGLVAGALVLPHWTDGALDRLDVLGGPGEGITVIGLPEQSGVVVENDTMTALGHRAASVVAPGTEPRSLPVGASMAAPR